MYFILLFVVLNFFVFQDITALNRTKLSIGGIFGGRSNPVEAARLAIADINENSKLLPDHELVLFDYNNPSKKVSI